MLLTFSNWKQSLLESAGSAGPAVRRMGDFVLQLFWKEGCEPTMAGLLDYAQAGLCKEFAIVVTGVEERPEAEA